MTHSELKAHLLEKLALPLPGEAAHQRMASSIRSSLKLRAQPDATTRTGAVCMLLYPKDGIWHIPLIVRPEYDGAHSGQVAFPGGKMEQFDADITAAALREMHEEIGVLPQTVEPLGLLTPVFVPVSNFVVHPVLAITAQKPDFRLDAREVAQLLELLVHELLDESRRGEKEIMVRGIRVRAPYFGLLGQTIWGATAMMLNELAEILKGSPSSGGGAGK